MPEFEPVDRPGIGDRSLSKPSRSGSDGHSCTAEFATHRRGVDIERQRNCGEGVSASVAAGGFADVVVAHLAAVHATRNNACIETCGDGPRMDSEFAGEIGQGASCPVCAHEVIDLDVVQASQDRSPRRV